MTERWKVINGYDSRYFISNFGAVIGQGGKLLNTNSNGDPYSRVVLCKKGALKTKRVHILVAEAFLGARPKGCAINHKDGDKRNNNVDNLEYCTPSQNTIHSYELGLQKRGVQRKEAKITEEDVRNIRTLYELGDTQQQIADNLYNKISRTQVGYIVRRQSWKHI